MANSLLSLSIAAGPYRQVLTTLPQFTVLLARSGLRGPLHLDGLCLDQRGQLIGSGGQFSVFIDRTRVMGDVVIKRVRTELLDDRPSSSKIDDRRKGHLRTIELEILALSHPPIRDHPNIIKVRSWGFDYPTRNRSLALPVLFMERASGSLLDLLENPEMFDLQTLSIDTRYQLCLDVLEGLMCLHNEKFVHGDVKPANILVFKQSVPEVPLVAKISDFGMCLSLEDESSIAYESYQGTAEWAAPELVRSRAGCKIQQDEILLSKCDVFSFGLLVLSLLFLSGEPPFEFDVYMKNSAIAAAHCLLDEYPATETLGQAWKSNMEKFVRSTLEIEPLRRSSLYAGLLESDCPAFHDWCVLRFCYSNLLYICLRPVLIKRNLRRSAVHTRLISNDKPVKPPHHQAESSYYSSLDFWSKLDVNIVSELESSISPTFNLKQRQILSGDSLFGLATATASYHNPGFQERYVRYVAYAAEALVPAAQGIAGRLLLANGITEYQDDIITASWLRSAVSSGSLTAEEDLRCRHPKDCQQIKQLFRASGGYNCKLNSTLTSFTSICDDPRELNVDKAKRICDKMGIADSPLDRESNTLLHYAATYGMCDVVSFLITKRKASVNISNRGGETSLYKACLSGAAAVVRTLVTLGADPTLATRPFGITCLHWLFNFDEDQTHAVASLLTSNNTALVNTRITPVSIGHQQTPIPAEHFPFHWPFGTPMHWAVAMRSRKAIDVLLGLQANIDALDLLDGHDGQSALGLACYRNDADMVDFLLSRGADAGWIGSKGRNLIHMMVLSPHSLNREFNLPRCIWSWVNHGAYRNRLHELQRCLDAMQAKGVQRDLRRDRSQTPLIDAVEADDTCAILALIRAGADCNVKCPTGELPVHRWLALDGRRLDYPMLYLQVLKELLGGTADIHTKEDLIKESVCHFAINTQGSDQQLQESMEILLLCDPPANINAQDRDGVSPCLKVLASLDTRNTAARVGILIQHGADTQKRNHNNEDFLYYLCNNARLSDDETMAITKTLMAQVVPAQDRRIAIQSYSKLDGSTALTKAVQNSKLNTVKYLISLGAALDVVDQKKRRTALDWALHTADIVRQGFIENVIDRLGIADQQNAIDDRTAFRTVVSWGGFPCRSPGCSPKEESR
ncbi:MAG: hypothetical protein L6R42_000729 [Xanthoria sp. 1 TBL-2021]|nr:MAG: hypothetical protein L6R42_000729 [Xanthoria sp. 1 TBL-2021]